MSDNISKEVAWESIKWHLATYKHELAKNGVYDSLLNQSIEKIEEYLHNTIQPVYCKDCELCGFVDYYEEYICRDNTKFVKETDYCSEGRRRQE